ncbi:CsgG/HfaB family protein [Stenotrophomonas sp.]|uniref:CsgG/HfaB family protein n=1 Tax=Stenotrophomonas sp. TaxID=69392 RepID=UPI0028A9A78F|nr:CsgG/HfaB family protein [Stenotrophomonas sp.]
MRMTTRLIGLGLVAALLAACGKEDAPAETAPAAKEKAPSALAANAPAEEAPLRGSPDFGGTTQVAREADGIGSTPELAVLAALQSAVAQVNGVRVASQMQSLRAGLHVDVDDQHVGDIRADAFTQQMIAGSQGAVLGYEILSQDEVRQLDEETIARVRASDEGWSFKGQASASASGQAEAKGSDGNASASASYKENYEENVKVDAKRGASSFDSDVTHRSMRSYWKVRVRAQIAQYRAPDEQGKPKIVVALPRTKAGSYAVGDGRVSADEVADAIRARLSDTLTQTQRFIVLDREFGDELQAEIDHINSGNVRLQDTARVGQQLATDLILIPTIERFEYPRSVRNLRMSDRQVTSYSGGGRITLRLINATTGQVVMSDSFDHQLASTGPSTLPRVVNGRNMAAAMMESLSGQIGTTIVTTLFPVSVVSVDGDQVVLSQGGESLQAGQRWQAVRLGEELKDPQTGRSLGRSEHPCCTIRIDRVAAQTSYGTIEEGVDAMRGGFRPGQVELRQKLGSKPAGAAAAAAGATASAAPAAAARPAAKPKPKPAAAPAEDPNW